MLIKCQECQNDVSDKAAFCPHCGFVFSVKPRKKLNAAKKLRLPNGFGRITKISGKNLRNPYRAMVTVGTDPDGRPLGKILKPKGYFRTYNEAYQALMEYHKSPFDLDKDMTVEEVYEKWNEEHSRSVSKSYAYQMSCAWKYCDPIKKEPIRSVKPSHLKFILDNGVKIDKDGNEKPIPVNTKQDVKSLLLGVFGYAVERDLIDRNIARDVTISKDAEKKMRSAVNPHTNYTDDELKILWKHEDDLFVRAVLIQCYSGWRPGELFGMKLIDVDLDNWTMTGGSKTENGKDRVVPIHSKIRHLVKENYELASKNGLSKLIVMESEGNIVNLAVTTMGNRMRAGGLPDEITEKHRWHDGRVTFVSLAKRYDVDEYAIKRIIGHAIEDLTEKVYTVRDLEWLRSEIEKIR